MTAPAKTLPKDRYKILWEKIRSSLEPVEVSCPKGAQERVINRMQKYKCRINVARRSMGLAGFGKLKIERKGDVISFFIETNGELF